MRLISEALEVTGEDAVGVGVGRHALEVRYGREDAVVLSGEANEQLLVAGRRDSTRRHQRRPAWHHTS